MATTATKRKSTGTSGRATNKARKDNDDAIKLTVSEILANTDAYPIPEDDTEIRKLLVTLAQYARSLEGQVASLMPQPKSAEELDDAMEKIRKAAAAGIKKQMGWKPSCKTGTAKWVYDGVCPDADVFGRLMGLSGPPTWKTKKLTVDEFEDLLGSIHGSVRYDTLYLKGNVNIRWSDSGEFKFSGTYGV
ncbi:hypothetical protein QCA50_000812 [Cerrena zonata]|uniref:Uncharacterized protein n=1 Tax=Cerrena zonata TaxID=2478898 RepID=A0AAW0GUA8_9APHY